MTQHNFLITLAKPNPSQIFISYSIAAANVINIIKLVFRILHDFVSHATKQKDDQSPERDMNEACSVSELEVHFFNT